MAQKAASKAIRNLRDLGVLPRKGGPQNDQHADIFDLISELAEQGWDAGQITNEVCDECGYN